jgi:hypothetical protein
VKESLYDSDKDLGDGRWRKMYMATINSTNASFEERPEFAVLQILRETGSLGFER